MDVQELSALLTSSTAHLKELHAQLGHPPEQLKGAIAALHDALKQAVDGQVSKVASEVKEARLRVQTLEGECQELKVALGEGEGKRTSIGERKGNAANGLGRASSSKAVGTTEESPLLPRIGALQSEWQRLKNLHTTRMEQASKLKTQLEAYRPLLGEFVDASLPSSAEDASTRKATNFDSVPVSYLNGLNASLASCASEVQNRRKQLEAGMHAILELWSELCYPPDVQPREDGSHSFDALILQHLRLQPVYAQVELVDEEGNVVDAAEEGLEPEYEFRGEFAQMQIDPVDGEEVEFSAPGSNSTPTRSSGSHVALGGTASRLLAAHELAPLKDNLSLIEAKRNHLQDEKTRREEKIQSLYDELVELWMKFDVGEEEMDAFVQSNCGSTAAVIEAYESELIKMRELKSQHMVLFISKVRQTIADLWDLIRMSPEERKQDFGYFFTDLDDGSGQIDAGVEPSDELLALHEEHVEVLKREAELKKVPLALVKKYRDLLDEGKALEESAKDQTRLMGRGARGDPGRLLREEKTRKRLKMLKPKLEDELQRAIPAWEEETGKVFTVDGVRFIDELMSSIGEAASKKRPRVASNATRPAALGASDVQNRQPAVAATPQMANKRQRVNSNMTGSSIKGAQTSSSSARIPSSVNSRGNGTYGQTPSTVQKPSSSRRPPVAAPTPTPLSMRPPNSKATKANPSPTKAGAAYSASSFGFVAPASRQQQQIVPSEASGKSSGAGAGFKAPTSFRPRPSTSFAGVGSIGAGGLSQGQMPRNISHNSVSSVDTNATTVIHAFPQHSPSRRPKTILNDHEGAGSSATMMMTTMTTTASTQRGKKRGPSLALQPSLQSSSASAFARPSISGAGASIRSIPSSTSITSLSNGATKNNGPSPNWAVLEDGEEDDLMQGDVMEDYALEADDLPSMRGGSEYLVA